MEVVLMKNTFCVGFHLDAYKFFSKHDVMIDATEFHNLIPD